MTALLKYKPRRTSAQVRLALKRAGLRTGPGQLRLADGQKAEHERIIWIDDGGVVWHHPRHRVIDIC